MVRFKNRYLLFEVETDAVDKAILQCITSRMLLGSIRESLLKNFGDIDAAKAFPSLAMKYWSAVLSLGIVRAARDHFRTVWASVTLLTHLEGLPETTRIRLRVVHVGGTIRSCQKFAAEHARRLIVEHKARGLNVQRLTSAASSAKQELSAMET